MFGRQARNGKLSPRRSTTFSNLLAEKRGSVCAWVCVCVYVRRAPLKLLLTFPLWHHFVWCRGTISIHSNILYFVIDFLFTCGAYQRNVCGAAIDRKNLFTQHWRGDFTCFIIFKTRTEGKRSNLIFLWDSFFDTDFSVFYFFDALLAAWQELYCWAPYYIHTKCAALCLVFICMHSEHWTRNSIYRLFSAFICCCITSIVFERRQRQKKCQKYEAKERIFCCLVRSRTAFSHSTSHSRGNR